MTLYDELIARGLIAQVTDEEKVKELINSGKATFYIGFDPSSPTATSPSPCWAAAPPSSVTLPARLICARC